MGHLRLAIVLVVLWAIAVHGKPGPRSAEPDEAGVIGLQVAQEAVARATDNPILAHSAALAARDTVPTLQQGNDFEHYRLGALGFTGMGRRFLREGGGVHDPELLAQIASDAAHAAVLEATTTSNAALATARTQDYTEAATNGNNLETWTMLSGTGSRRRLGERAAGVDPATMQLLATMAAQDAVRLMNARNAAAFGREAGMAAAAANDLHSEWHLAKGDAPEKGIASDWPVDGRP